MRIKSGIEGFDKLVEGGIPAGSAVLVCGAPGTGKSIFGLQFIAQGALAGENCLYISIEENPEKLFEQGEQFGWDFKKFQKEGRVVFLKIPTDVANYNLITSIKNAVESCKPKRIVVDSISVLAINASSYQIPILRKESKEVAYAASSYLIPSGFTIKEQTMQFVYLLISRLKSFNATLLVIADAPENDRYLTRDTVSEFACDGVVHLKLMSMGKTVSRTLEIKKMRNTNLKPGICTMIFDKDGIKVKGFEY